VNFFSAGTTGATDAAGLPHALDVPKCSAALSVELTTGATTEPKVKLSTLGSPTAGDAVVLGGEAAAADSCGLPAATVDSLLSTTGDATAAGVTTVPETATGALPAGTLGFFSPGLLASDIGTLAASCVGGPT
jgi:hypothetical protein